MQNTSSAVLKSKLSQHVNIDSFLTFWAMEVLAGHWDGYTGSNNQYLLPCIGIPQQSSFTFIPWGLDDVFDPGIHEEEGYISQSLPALTNVPILKLFRAKSSFGRENKRAIGYGVWNEDELLAEIDRMEFLLSDEPYMEDHISIEMNALRDCGTGAFLY